MKKAISRMIIAASTTKAQKKEKRAELGEKSLKCASTREKTQKRGVLGKSSARALFFSPIKRERERERTREPCDRERERERERERKRERKKEITRVERRG